MGMTFDQYINNPMGIHNSVISNREMYRSMYTQKLDRIMLRENGKVNYILFKTKSEFYVYIKIPSETIENFYYDVVVKFEPVKGKALAPERTLNNYNVRFYSNDPSFVFTFAHSFIKNGIFIDELKHLMSKEAIKTVAKEKNPTDQVGYVKTIYFAYLLLKRKGLFSKIVFDTAQEFKVDIISKYITPADIKINNRIDAGNEKSKTKKRKKGSVTNRNNIENQSNDSSVKITKFTKVTPVTRKSENNSIRTTKSTNIVKTARKTKRI